MVNLGDLVFSIICEDKASTTVGDAAAKIGSALTTAGAAVTAFGGAATLLIDDGRKMDASFRTTALSAGLPAEAIKGLARDLQSVDSPISEVAATLDVLSRAGMNNVEAMGATASAFDTLADGIGVNADTLTSAMVPAFNALNVELSDAPQYIDGLSVMFRKSNVDLSDFSSMVQRMGPDLGQMGLGLNDVSAILMAFAERGITGRKATTELTQAINAADGDVSKLYASLGIAESELAGYRDQMGNAAGAAQQFADAQNSSFGTLDKIGFELTKVKQKITDAITPFEGLAAAALGIGPAMMGAGQAMNLLGNETVQKMVPSLGKVVSSLTGAGGLMGALGAVGPAILTFATGPIGIAIAAIVAIGAAIVLLDSKFHFIGPTIEWFGNLFKGIGDWLGNTFGPIIDGVIGYFGELSDSMGGTGDLIQDIIDWFGWLGQAVFDVGGKIGEYLTPAIQFVAGVIGDYLKPKIEDMITVFGLVVSAINTYVIPALQWLWEKLNEVYTIVANTVGPAIERLSSVLAPLAQAIGLTGDQAATASPKVGDLGTKMQTAGANAGTAAPNLGSAATNMAGAGSAAGGAAPKILSAASALNGAATAGNAAAAGANSARSAYEGWYNYYQSHNPPTAPAAPPLSPSSNPSTPETKAKAKDDADAARRRAEDEAKRKAGEGPVNGHGITVVRQWVEGGYWWTQFSDGTKKRGAAATTQPKAGDKTKKYHSGGIVTVPGPATEGMAMLLEGERVVPRGDVQRSGADVRAIVSEVLTAVLGAGGGGDVVVHGNIQLSNDYGYDRFRDDVARWAASRLAKGMIG
jgi:hypothetical protein